jgi:hypothetical protein
MDSLKIQLENIILDTEVISPSEVSLTKEKGDWHFDGFTF